MRHNIFTQFIYIIFSFQFIFCYANDASIYMDHIKEVLELERKLASSYISNFYQSDLVQTKYANGILDSFSSLWAERIKMGNELEAEIESITNELKTKDVSKISTDKYGSLVRKKQDLDLRFSNLLILSEQIQNTIDIMNSTNFRNFYSYYCSDSSHFPDFLSIKPQPDIFTIPQMTFYSREKIDIENAANFYQKNSILSNKQEFEKLASGLCQNMIAQSEGNFNESLSTFDSKHYLDDLKKFDNNIKYLLSSLEDIFNAIDVGLKQYYAELILKDIHEKSVSSENISNALHAYHILVRDGIKSALVDQYLKNLKSCSSMLDSFQADFALLDFIEINIRSKFIDDLNQDFPFFKTELKENIDAIEKTHTIMVENCYRFY